MMSSCLIQVRNEQCQIARQPDDNDNDFSDNDEDDYDENNEDFYSDIFSSPEPSSSYKWKNFTVSPTTVLVACVAGGQAVKNRA